MSKREEYRGEDHTLEMIRTRHKEIMDLRHGELTPEMGTFCWNTACDELSEEMKNTGLHNTAKTIFEQKI